MKTPFLLFIFFSFLSFCQSPNPLVPPIGEDLLLIENHGKYGLVNKNGDEILSPIYDWVGSFSDGLAAVALNGLFGYVNAAGEFVIKPQYHYAKDFKNQYAEVMLNGKWFYIGKNGETVEKINTSIKSRKKTIINKKTELILDSLQATIGYSKNGKYIIRRNEKRMVDGRPHSFTKNALMDTLGRVIIPFGKYDEIKLWGENEFLFVNRKNKEIIGQGILDVHGNIRHEISHVDPIGYLENGMAKTGFNTGSAYAQGIIGPNGEWILRDESINHLKIATEDRLIVVRREGDCFADYKGRILHNEPFVRIGEIIHNKYAVVIKGEGRKKYVANLNGNLISDEPIGYILQNNHPNENYIVVYKNGGYYKFDINGNFTQFNILNNYGVAWDKKGYYKLNSKNSDRKNYGIGWYNPQDGSVVEPRFEMIHHYRSSYDIRWVKENGRWGYVNKWGDYIWREKENDDLKKPVALYKTISRYEAYKPRKLNKWMDNFFNNVHVRVSPFSTVYNKEYEGKKVYISNTTKDTIHFRLESFNRLQMTMQAKDENGLWRDIETMRGLLGCGTGWRGNWALPPGHYWSFRIPKYDGAFKTKFRMVLKQFPDWAKEEGEVWYSNEFSGGVNPGQFYDRK